MFSAIDFFDGLIGGSGPDEGFWVFIVKSRSPFVGQLIHGLWPLGGGLTWRPTSSPKRSSRGGLSRSLTLVACVVISPISTISLLAFWPPVDNRRYLQVRKSVHHTASIISVTVAQSHIDHFIVVPGAGFRARSQQGLSAAAARRCRGNLRLYHSFAADLGFTPTMKIGEGLPRIVACFSDYHGL